MSRNKLYPIRVWFDDDYPDSVSVGYAIRKIRDEMAQRESTSVVSYPNEADIIHLNTIPYNVSQTTLALQNTPVVVTQHGGYHWWRNWSDLCKQRDWRYGVVRALHTFTSRLVSRIGFSTASTRKLAVGHGKISEQKTRVIPLGKSEHYSNKHQTNTTEPFVISVINDVNERKNITTLFKTMRELSDINFVLPGKIWPEYPEELPENAIVTGYVDESKLIEYYNRASALYLPTLYEGFGLPFVEAMACGTAVATTKGGAPEEVCGSAATYLHDPFDPEEHADKIRTLITNDEFREELEKRGLQRASKYSWGKTADRYIEVYEELLG